MVNSTCNHGTTLVHMTLIVLLLNVTLWPVAIKCWDKHSISTVLGLALGLGLVQQLGAWACVCVCVCVVAWKCLKIRIQPILITHQRKYTINKAVYDHNIDGIHSHIKDRERESLQSPVDMFFFLHLLERISSVCPEVLCMFSTLQWETERARYSIKPWIYI